MKANRLVLLAVAGAAVVLSGCTPTGNVAARVGDTTVTTSEVNFLTRMQCDTLDRAAKDPSQSANAKLVPAVQVRSGMVNTLIQSELNRQLAEREDLRYDEAMLRSVMEQFEPVVAEVPEKDRERFRDVVEDVYRGQLQVYTLAQDQLQGQGISNPTQDQVEQQVASIQDAFRKSVDIDVNPEYGADEHGVAGAADPSLSRPVSAFAKDARAAQPDATWVSKLPADQRCG